ncbi:unnamed protein product [Rhodiola kirilowii]
MSSYYGREPWNDEEFSPPSFKLEVREKIINLEQSWDETLDEYLSYFDSIVTSCPHHGFTNFYLLQRFLGGMMPHEWNRLNDAAAGGSVNNLTMSDLWDLIEDMAESSKQDQAKELEELANMVHQIQVDLANTAHNPMVIKEELTMEPTEPAEDEDPWLTEEELNSDYPGHLEEDGPLAPEEEPAEPLESDLITELPETVPVLAAEIPETCPDFIANLAETGPVLTIRAPEADPDLTAEAAEEIKVDWKL